MYFPIQPNSEDKLNGHEQDFLRIHSLETFGTHDGPGIRMVVFLQGCQFRCVYCQNPDTLSISGGTMVAINELVTKAINQKLYFLNGGGVTVSGGEPLLQRSKLKTFFEKLHDQGISTCLDTNGRILDNETKSLFDRTDLVLLDVKHINDECHKKLTGVSNNTTLEVAEYRESTGKPMWLRYVLVPDWSDQEEYLHKWAQHFKDYKTIEKVEIIPFHQLGKFKWDSLGFNYPLAQLRPANQIDAERCAAIFSQYLNNIKIK